MGVLTETFETAITWDRLPGLIERRRREAPAGEAEVTCRLTHAYPDGAAPYFTVLAPARRGDEEEQWAAVKRAAAAAIARGGRHDHAPPRGRPRPPRRLRPPAARAVRRRATAPPRRRSTPPALLNPGVLLNP